MSSVNNIFLGNFTRDNIINLTAAIRILDTSRCYIFTVSDINFSVTTEIEVSSLTIRRIVADVLSLQYYGDVLISIGRHGFNVSCSSGTRESV